MRTLRNAFRNVSTSSLSNIYSKLAWLGQFFELAKSDSLICKWSSKWNWSVEEKAKELGITLENYQHALEYLKNHHRFRLGITLLRHENDFLDNWWRNIKLSEKWAKEKKSTIKRLLETGRIKHPNESDNKREIDKPIIIKPLNSENGKVQISEEDNQNATRWWFFRFIIWDGPNLFCISLC